MKFYSKNELKTSRVFFDKNPPQFMTLFIIIVFIILIFGIFISASVIKPYIVKASGTVVAENTHYISVNVSGSIDQIYVESGQSVKAGDLLFSITSGMNGLESKIVLEQISELEELLDVIDKFEKSLNTKKNLLNKRGKELEYYSLVEYYLDILKIEEYQKNLTLKDLEEKKEQKNKIVTEINELEVKLSNNNENENEDNITNIKSQLDSKLAEKNQLQEEIESLQNELKNPYSQGNQTYLQMLSELGQTRTNVQTQLIELNAKYKVLSTEDSNYDVVATSDGIIHYLIPLKTGMSVQQSQVIAEISNNDSNQYYIEAFIHAADRSKVNVGDEVNISLTGINTMKFGTIKGNVKEIDQGTISQDTSQGTLFFYRCIIEMYDSTIKSRKNETIQVIHSMPAEARIVYEKETYLEWILKLLNFSL